MTPLRLWPRSLFGRHLLLMACLIFLAELLLAAGAVWLVQRPRLEQTTLALQADIQRLEGALAHMDAAQRQTYATSVQQGNTGVRLAQQPPPTPQVPNSWPLRLAQRQLQAGLGQTVLLTRAPDATPWFWLRLAPQGEGWWLGLDVGHLEPERGRLWWGALLATACLALLGAWLIQRHLHRPLRQLMQAAQALTRGQYPQLRWPANTPSEVLALGHAFDRMAGQLEDNEQQRALMLAGLSHDLRTPLAKLRLAVEILQVEGEEELLRGMARNIEVADQVIGQFIDFARSDTQEPTVPCDLAELVQDVVAVSASSRLRCMPPGVPVPVLLCRPLGLRRALGNLIDNALKYSPGEVTVSWACDAQEVELAVQDQGPGIAPEAWQQVVQPFVRQNDARSGPPGAGLGLAIVERVMAQIDGRLELSAPPGLRATLRWPLLRP